MTHYVASNHLQSSLHEITLEESFVFALFVYLIVAMLGRRLRLEKTILTAALHLRSLP